MVVINSGKDYDKHQYQILKNIILLQHNLRYVGLFLPIFCEDLSVMLIDNLSVSQMNHMNLNSMIRIV